MCLLSNRLDLKGSHTVATKRESFIFQLAYPPSTYPLVSLAPFSVSIPLKGLQKTLQSFVFKDMVLKINSPPAWPSPHISRLTNIYIQLFLLLFAAVTSNGQALHLLPICNQYIYTHIYKKKEKSGTIIFHLTASVNQLPRSFILAACL